MLLLSNMLRYSRVHDNQTEATPLTPRPPTTDVPGRGPPFPRRAVAYRPATSQARSSPASKSTPVIDVELAESVMTGIPANALESALSEAAEATPKEALASLEREQALAEEERQLQMESATSERDDPIDEAAVDAEHDERLSREQARTSTRATSPAAVVVISAGVAEADVAIAP